MDFQTCYSSSRTLPSKARETPLASCPEASEEVTGLGEFAMAHSWHLPLRSQHRGFVSAARADRVIWGVLTLIRAKRG